MSAEDLERLSGSGVPLGAEASYARSDDDGMEEDEDLYVAEYHLPLDVDSELTPMDTTHWWHEVERAQSPVPSYTSMGSDSMYQSEKREEEPATRLQLERTDSFSSCYSFDSDDCEIRKPKVRSQDNAVVQPPLRPELIRDPDEIRHPALTVGFVFKAISKTLGKLPEGHLKYFKAVLWRRYPETFTTPPQFMDMVDLVDRLLESYDLEVSLQIIRALLKDMNKEDLEAYLQELCLKNEVRYELRMTLKKRYAHVYEGMTTQGELSEQKDFDNVFSNVHVSSRAKNGPNVEHEVREIKKINNHRDADKKLPPEEIMGPIMIGDGISGKVMTVGMAGMGKSMLVQKVIRDWAEERSHHHIYFLFPLPFRELNQYHSTEMSFKDLVHAFYPETERLKDFDSDEGKLLFVCDGLDEYIGELDFYRTVIWNDPEGRTSLKTLMVNFLKGNMYYRSHVWLTSRPRRALRMPREYLDQRTEALGFNDDEKEEYFRKRFEDPVQADRVIAHLNSCKTLHIMCHVPLFCWLVSEEFQRAFREQGSQAELPRSITLMYTKFLLMLLRTRSLRAPPRTPEEERDFLMKLGKLAYVMLDKGAQVRISKDHKKECEVDFEEAVVNSGLCTEFETEEIILYIERICCFTHSTVQEYLAALYLFLTFQNHGKNALEQPLKGKLSWIFKDNSLLDLCKSAVEKSLHCEDGSLDVFLRFLLGMGLEANHDLLKPFLTSAKWSPVTKDIVALLKKVIGENHHPERNANLQRCLEELDVGTSGAASRRRSSSLKERLFSSFD